jgi:hypothetical protein
VPIAGVQRDQLELAELEWHLRHLQRAEVDPQCVIVLAEQRRELVEQARLRADPVVLDLRADLRQLDPVRLGNARQCDQRERERDLERRRR